MSAQPQAGLKAKSDGPPEPPTRPLTGSVYESTGIANFCRVPGCSAPDRPFAKMNAIAIHVARRHGLTLEGKPAGLRGAAPPPTPPVSVRGIVVGTEGSLVAQAIRIVEAAKLNLGGKLTEMDLIRRKAERLEVILTYMRELV